MNIIEALDDDRVFGSAFRDPTTWHAWRIFLRAVFALPMTEAERRIYELHTGRHEPPKTPPNEIWTIAGRRGGKSRTAATIACYLATLRRYDDYLAPGEVATIALIAQDRRAARTLMRYCVGLLESVPMLRNEIEHITAETIHLRSRAVLEIHTSSYRSTRGYTLAGVVADEIAFWPADETSANPDSEVISALRPGLVTIPGAPLIAISSPYSQRGELWNAYRKHHGVEGDPTLVWIGTTRELNPTVPESVIERALAEDEPRARAEYLAQWRTDVVSFLSRETIESVVMEGVEEQEPSARWKYVAFCDPSGGASDSFTLAIAHSEMNGPYRIAVLDALREVRPPFNPDEVVGQFVWLLMRYGVSTVVADRYGGDWVKQAFRREKTTLRHSDLSKSEIYRECLPGFTSGFVRLLDSPRLVSQLANLERRTARGGRDSIDHPPGAHDDVANAAAGALWLILRKPANNTIPIIKL